MDKSHIEALAINIVSKANRSSENINIPKVDPCPICGEDIYTLEGGIIKEFTLASCGDIFHQKCLEEYLVDALIQHLQIHMNKKGERSDMGKIFIKCFINIFEIQLQENTIFLIAEAGHHVTRAQ
ncbi:hypothetical protein RclHR1_23230007 [Rhizophagus clarus]|uniref:RING-type domain-containing protein n=1 Tax=Rhizophagus clarus TaxID=94130 RepID=A0A2Z6QXK7_9GLOM|nr:hypothetical protein RclHR1_23230007 [Rhizophagus clarus]